MKACRNIAATSKPPVDVPTEKQRSLAYDLMGKLCISPHTVAAIATLKLRVRDQNRTDVTQNPPNPAKTGLPFFSGATKIGRKHQNPERETTIFAL